MNSDTFDKLITAAGLYSSDPELICTGGFHENNCYCNARCVYTTMLTISDEINDIVKVSMPPSNLDSYDIEDALRMEAIIALLKCFQKIKSMFPIQVVVTPK